MELDPSNKTEQTIIKITNEINLRSTYTYNKLFKVAEQEEDEEGAIKQISKINQNLILSHDSKEELILHWGLAFKNIKEWVSPDKINLPPNTKKFDQKAVQTLIKAGEEVQITFDSDDTHNPKALNFVINLPATNKWYNNNNQDYRILLEVIQQKQPGSITLPDFVEGIIDCEVNYGSWTLMHRYNKCYDILNSIEIGDVDKMLWLFIWLRYSYIRVLDWQRSFNTKPKELSHSMSRLTYDIAAKFCKAYNSSSKDDNFILDSANVLKMMMGMLGKGTGDGQKIRDEILHILHRHHIKETNDHFYEQWHQKLHNNTTPDDVVICQAVISYLRSGGNMKVYWDTLNKEGVTRERLANFERKIVAEPFYKPELIGDLENYLGTLKAVHSSADLVLMFHSCKYAFGHDYQKFEEIVNNKDHWDSLQQLGRITYGRQLLTNIIKGSLNDVNKVRDLLFFDICLEAAARQQCEKIIHIELEFEYYVNEITAIMKNLNTSYSQNFSEENKKVGDKSNNHSVNTPSVAELKICLDDWQAIVDPIKKQFHNDVNNTLKIKSVCDRMSRFLSSVIDHFTTKIDEKAKYLGNNFKTDEFVVNLFTEEIIRGSIFFALSMVLKKIEPILRKSANLGPWQIISPGKDINLPKKGKLQFVKNLKEVQFKVYEENTVLLTESVGGNEEVPINVSCLIIIHSRDYPDVLAHVSVRARNLGIPFLVCFDDKFAGDTLRLEGQYVSVKIVNQNVIEIEKISQKQLTTEKLQEESVQTIELRTVAEKFEKIIIAMSDFNQNQVGAKSSNTNAVHGKLSSKFKYPESLAIPFNVCEYFLKIEENLEVASEIKELQIQLYKSKKVSPILQKCREAIMRLKFIQNDTTSQLVSTLVKFGIKKEDFDKAWTAIKSVWASKYNERAYLSVTKIKNKVEDINMAILVQKIIPADYSFVIHTKNPMNNSDEELYAEVVYGMGETLVGTYEGQALSFTYNKKSNTYMINSYPNKSIALKGDGFIFRSDSNTEDLEGFAGAGLFDSVPLTELKEVRMCYGVNPLLTDSKFTDAMIGQISLLGVEVEKLLNGAQDIEGVIYQNDCYIVQTRPQV